MEPILVGITVIGGALTLIQATKMILKIILKSECFNTTVNLRTSSPRI